MQYGDEEPKLLLDKGGVRPAPGLEHCRYDGTNWRRRNENGWIHNYCARTLRALVRRRSNWGFWALLDHARLELLHFHTYPIYPYGDVVMALDPATDFIESLLDIQKEKLDHLADRLQASHRSLVIKTTVVEDSISHAIGNHIKKSEADLVVLGTRGRTGLKSIFLGTKAEKIIRLTS